MLDASNPFFAHQGLSFGSIQGSSSDAAPTEPRRPGSSRSEGPKCRDLDKAAMGLVADIGTWSWRWSMAPVELAVVELAGTVVGVTVVTATSSLLLLSVVSWEKAEPASRNKHAWQ